MNALHRQSDTGRKEFLVLLLIFSYVFDEVMNAVIRSNFSGMALLAGYAGLMILLSRWESKQFSVKGLVLLVMLTLFSCLAFISPLGCSLESKGILSLILLAMAIVLLGLGWLEGIGTKPAISNAILWLIFFLLWTDYAGWGIRQLMFGSTKGSGPYSETSHLAMYLLPILIYRLLLCPRDILALLVVLSSIILAPSSTLMVGVLAIVGMYFLNSTIRLRSGLLLLLMLIVGMYLAIIEGWVDPSNTLNRVANVLNGYEADKADHTNLSALVWLNGWSQAYQTLEKTSWLGTGFNQMGCGDFAEVGALSPLILDAKGIVLNANDGSFLASKMLAEMGVLGAVLIVWLTSISMWAVARISCNLERARQSVYLCRAAGGICVLMYLYVRGTGYFQLPFLVALAMLINPRWHSSKSKSEQSAPARNW